MNIYEITNELLELQEMLCDPEIDEQVLQDTLESVSFDFEQKAESYAKIIKNLDADAEAYKREIDRLIEKRNSTLRGVERLKNTLKSVMEVTGIKKVKGSVLSLSLQKNGGVCPLVFKKDVPDDYMRVIKEPDNAKIREALKDGTLDFAELGERGTSVRIK